MSFSTPITRLNKRAISLIEDFSAKPTASIPQACGDWTDTQAAYRFFDNDKVDWQDILAPHIQNSVARMAAHDVVLCIQDTTELDFNGQKATGLGPLKLRAPAWHVRAPHLRCLHST